MKSTFLLSMLCLIGMACSKSNPPTPATGDSTLFLTLRDTLTNETLDSVRVMEGRLQLKDIGYSEKGYIEFKPTNSALFWFSKPGYQLHSQTCDASGTLYLKPYIPFLLQIDVRSSTEPIWLYGSFNESPLIIQSDTSIELSHAALSWVKWKYQHQSLQILDSVFLTQNNQVFQIEIP
ncbi:MAG: hypothetical protein EP332_02800 [Bacteroidetes bacterium]|nr:MAG: hypothetical protein EP332_02800 [Bacteroidota bacterium]